VDERVVPETLDAIAEWTGELMGKLTTLETSDQRKTEEAFNLIHDGLTKETIEQLVESIEKRRKKLLEKK